MGTHYHTEEEPSRQSPSSRAEPSQLAGEPVPKKRRSLARKTIHPRITQQTQSAGTRLAQSRNEKLNTFWSTVIVNGLPITAALTPPDEEDMHGPWSGKQLAKNNRMLVDQLIAFQIYH